MKRALALFGIVALAPAALAVTPASASVLHLAICAGTDNARTISVPIPGKPAGDEPCCVKGCHAGGNRKRTAC